MYPHFSPSELRPLLSITHKCLQAKDHHDVIDALDSLYALIPFKAAGIGMVKRPGLWINHSFDVSWTESYLANNYNEVDPVLKIADRTPRPFTWEQARCLVGQGKLKTKTFLEHAKREGVYNGIAVSSHGMGNDGLDILVTLHMGKEVLPKNWMVILQMFVVHIYEAFMRLHHTPQTEHRTSPLTSREIETLKWAREGKSAWEIGRIMGISERTVKFHFSNIYTKLDVVNRAQAVALGVSRKMI